MKKNLLFMLMLIASATSFASVNITEANFGDAIFRSWVSDNCDTDGDGVLSDSEIAAVTTVDVSEMGIAKLDGIEFLTAVEELICSGNELTSLKISQNLKLRFLDCHNNQIVDNVYVAPNTALEYINCEDNKLTNLDARRCMELKELYCSRNQIQVLYIPETPTLTTVWCSDNQISNNTFILITSLPKVASGQLRFHVDNTSTEYNTITNEQIVDAYKKGWTLYNYDGTNWNVMEAQINIDEHYFPDAYFRSFISTNYDSDGNHMLSTADAKAVVAMNVASLSISSLKGIEYFVPLKTLQCHSNELTSLDISNNINLVYLYVDNNQLTALDVSENPNLETINCTGNELTALDVTNCTKVNSIYCSDNKIKQEAMDAFIASLPTVSSGEMRLYDLDNDDQSGNEYSNENLISAASKGWSVLGFNGSEWLEIPVSIAVNESNFPDANFREWVSSNVDTDSNNYLNKTEIMNVTNITVVEKGIADLTGIGYFSELTNLNCSGNQIASLDLSKNLKLETLRCVGNELTEIDLSKNLALTGVFLSECKLTAVDVSMLTNLKNLSVDNNPIAEINVSSNAKLEVLQISNTDIASLDISKNTKLKNLYARHAKLKNLDFSNNLAIQKVICIENNITYDAMTALIESLPTRTGNDGVLQAADASSAAEHNVLLADQVEAALAKGWTATEVTLEGEVTIDEIHFPDANFRTWVSENCDTDSNGILNVLERANISKMNISNLEIANLAGIEYFPEVVELNCSYNNLTSIDLSQNVKIMILNCGSNQLTTLDFTNNTQLCDLKATDNKLTSIDLTKCAELTDLTIYDNELTSIDVSKNKKLDFFGCYRNKLTALDVTNNTQLTYLSFSNNEITEIDISNNKLLRLLNCESNKLTSLSISGYPNLESVYCELNEIASLEVSNNPKLFTLDCSNNKLRELNLEGNVRLNRFKCSSNKLRTLDFTGLANLRNFYGYNNLLIGLDFSDSPLLTYVDCRGGRISRAAMTLLINSLPTLSSGEGELLATYGSSSSNDNELLQEQADAASAKGWTATVVNAEPIVIDEANFPDDNFRAWVSSECDSNNDGILGPDEIATVTDIDVSGKDIADLTGIGFFTEVTFLDCSNNKLTQLDLSKLVKLQILYCFKNQLTSLTTVSNCPDLYIIKMEHNLVNETEMGKLIEALPVRPDNNGELYATAADETSDENCLTQAQADAAAAKGWTATYVNDQTAIRDINAHADAQSVEIHNIGGQYVGKDLKQLPRGIYIVGGKKVVKQ